MPETPHRTSAEPAATFVRAQLDAILASDAEAEVDVARLMVTNVAGARLVPLHLADMHET